MSVAVSQATKAMGRLARVSGNVDSVRVAHVMLFDENGQLHMCTSTHAHTSLFPPLPQSLTGVLIAPSSTTKIKAHVDGSSVSVCVCVSL